MREQIEKKLGYSLDQFYEKVQALFSIKTEAEYDSPFRIFTDEEFDFVEQYCIDKDIQNGRYAAL